MGHRRAGVAGLGADAHQAAGRPRDVAQPAPRQSLVRAAHPGHGRRLAPGRSLRGRSQPGRLAEPGREAHPLTSRPGPVGWGFARAGRIMRAVAELFDRIGPLRQGQGKVAVATLVNTRGTTPRKEGAKMLVGEDGGILGSVTIGGCVDAQVLEEAADVLHTMRPRLLEMNLGDEEAWEIGLTCGGTIEVFVEPLAMGGDEAGA